jgi:hypothetical protein
LWIGDKTRDLTELGIKQLTNSCISKKMTGVTIGADRDGLCEALSAEPYYVLSHRPEVAAHGRLMQFDPVADR